MKKLIIFLLMIGIIKSQNQGLINIPSSPIINSPQAMTMERFGNVPVSINSGNVSYDINLFNYSNIYNNEGYSIDIKYFGTGFMPAKQSNYVGLDWMLNIGGSITREVRGVPDDYFSDFVNYSPTNKGFGYLEGIKSCNKTNNDIYNQNYATNPFNQGGFGIKCGNYTYELEPDKFNFNFIGGSGYFFIGNDQKPIIVSDTPNLKIDISELSSRQPLHPNTPTSKCITKETTIKITDGKGIKYYFGGIYDNLDVSYNLSPNSSSNASQLTVTSWNLYKIEYPNSKVLEIKYVKPDIAFQNISFCTQESSVINLQEPFLLMFDHHHVAKQYFRKENSSYNTNSGNIFYDGTIYWGSSSQYVEDATNSFGATKKSFPEKVLLDGKPIVKFNYQRFDKYSTITIPSLKIKSINFYDDSENIVKETEFNYYRYKNYFFLEKLKMFRKSSTSPDFVNEYSFDYYQKNNLPDENIGTVDYWGYWNSRPRPKIVPNFTLNRNTAEFVFTQNFWEAEPNLANVSLLKTITYPSKGKSEFIYEPHTYSQKIDRNYYSQFKNTLVNTEGFVGGGRIKKIINYSEDGVQTDFKEYKYIENYSPASVSTKSSGILSNFYQNFSYFKTENPFQGKEILEIYSDNHIESVMNTAPVLYSEVTEIDNNKGFIKYFFTDVKTNPDSEVFKAVDNPIHQFNDNYLPVNITNINLPYRSNNYKRGKLYKKEVYDSGFIKLNSSYTDFVDFSETTLNNFVTHVIDNGRTKYFFKMFGGSFLPSTTITEEIFDNNTITNQTDYFYSGFDKLNISKVFTFQADGSVLNTSYKYAREKGDTRLINANMIGIPLETETKKNNKVISKVETKYENLANLFPSSVISTDLNNINSTEIIFDQYDLKGNLQQYTTKDGVVTSIIWGYNSTQPIAKVTGVSYSVASSLAADIISASNGDIDAGTEQTLIGKLDIFRKESALQNAQISTYTYDPLIGVTSITPPSGIREIYKYDSANRLESIKDINGKLLKEFKYNYKH